MMESHKRKASTEKEKEFSKTVDASLEFVAQEFCKSVELGDGIGRGLSVQQNYMIDGKKVVVQLKIMEKPDIEDIADQLFGGLEEAFNKWKEHRGECDCGKCKD